MAKKSKYPPMLVSKPIEERLDQLRAKVDEQKKWNGSDAPSVRTGELMIAEIEDAMRQAAEMWETTKAAAVITGWDAQTLVRWARAKLAGEKVPFAWRQLQVRKDPAGYSFKISTVPAKARKSA